MLIIDVKQNISESIIKSSLVRVEKNSGMTNEELFTLPRSVKCSDLFSRSAMDGATQDVMTAGRDALTPSPEPTRYILTIILLETLSKMRYYFFWRIARA